MELSFGLIELTLVFGAALAFGVWEIVSVRRSLRRDKVKEKSLAQGDE